jgi:predicted small lipoprotein YifL
MIRRVMIACALSFLLQACGQMGPLQHPQEPNNAGTEE